MQCCQFFIVVQFCKNMSKIQALFFAKVWMPDWQIYGQNIGFCDLGYNQSVIELFAQHINITFTCTKLQNTGKITQTIIEAIFHKYEYGRLGNTENDFLVEYTRWFY